MINRIILPVISTQNAEGSNVTGFGDISWSAWFAPSKASKVTWGVGPVIQVPTGSNADEFGTREWGVGPSLVVLTSIDKWVIGLVTNNVWTFGDIKENKFVFQYFANYNLPNAWYLVTAPINTANWNIEESSERWVIPFGGGAGKVVRFGKLPVNINLQAYYNAFRPDNVGAWGTRFQIQFLFPK